MSNDIKEVAGDELIRFESSIGTFYLKQKLTHGEFQKINGQFLKFAVNADGSKNMNVSKLRSSGKTGDVGFLKELYIPINFQAQFQATYVPIIISHVVTKKGESIKEESKVVDLLNDLDHTEGHSILQIIDGVYASISKRITQKKTA